jgi:hypothetical protein
MSLRRLVVEMITEIGGGTVDQIMPRLSALGYTRDQAAKALHNAASLNLVWSEGSKRAGVKRGGLCPTVFWPGRNPGLSFRQLVRPEERPMVSSVFELGNPKPASAWPKAQGTVYSPLGGWREEAEEGATA